MTEQSTLLLLRLDNYCSPRTPVAGHLRTRTRTVLLQTLTDAEAKISTFANRWKNFPA